MEGFIHFENGKFEYYAKKGSNEPVTKSNFLPIKFTKDYLVEPTEILEFKLFSDEARTNQISETFYLNVNDPTGLPPTDLSISSYKFIEDILPNSVIGILSSTDQSSNDTHTYSFTNSLYNDNNLFKIEDNKLLINEKPNYSLKNFYVLELKTTDSGGNQYSERIELNVNPLNKNRYFATDGDDRLINDSYNSLINGGPGNDSYVISRKLSDIKIIQF